MLTMTRRDLLHTAAAGAAALTLSPLAAWAAEEKKAGFTLPKLPYDYDALEPHIDAETMKIHHDLHHKAYVDNLNKALAGQSELLAKPVEEILRDINSVPKNIRQAVINHGGGHANHTMFWEIMGKDGGKPGGELAKARSRSARRPSPASAAAGAGWWSIRASSRFSAPPIKTAR